MELTNTPNRQTQVEVDEKQTALYAAAEDVILAALTLGVHDRELEVTVMRQLGLTEPGEYGRAAMALFNGGYMTDKYRLTEEGKKFRYSEGRRTVEMAELLLMLVTQQKQFEKKVQAFTQTL